LPVYQDDLSYLLLLLIVVVATEDLKH